MENKDIVQIALDVATSELDPASDRQYHTNKNLCSLGAYEIGKASCRERV